MKKLIDGTTSIMIIAVIAILTFSITFAWYNGYLTSNTVNFSKSSKLNVNYDGGSNITGSIIPAANKNTGLSKSVTVSLASGSAPAKLSLELKINDLPTEIASSLNYEVYLGSSKLSNGTFSGKTSDSTLTILSNQTLSTTSKTYTVYIWLDGSKAGNEAQNKSISVELYAYTNVITGSNG